jgi:hypothetical protein
MRITRLHPWPCPVTVSHFQNQNQNQCNSSSSSIVLYGTALCCPVACCKLLNSFSWRQICSVVIIDWKWKYCCYSCYCYSYSLRCRSEMGNERGNIPVSLGNEDYCCDRCSTLLEQCHVMWCLVTLTNRPKLSTSNINRWLRLSSHNSYKWIHHTAKVLFYQIITYQPPAST